MLQERVECRTDLFGERLGLGHPVSESTRVRNVVGFAGFCNGEYKRANACSHEN